jgi:hypothetical protein
MKSWHCCFALLVLASCAGTDDLRGIAAKPPLDRSVLVTGGAFFSPLAGSEGTFALPDLDSPERLPDANREAIPFSAILDVLNRGRVFQHVVGDTDATRRRQLRQQLRLRSNEGGLSGFLQQAREDGFDLLVLVEELRDGPIESQGTNNRWPVTFATWFLLGVGALIPDRTFESRATLRVSLRELQSGREIANLEVESGPIELALTERTGFLGLAASIIVPPFWVYDDREAVAESVRATTERRLLLSLASKLKSEVFRRRIDNLAAADIQLQSSPEGVRVVVQSSESLSVVRLKGPGYTDEVVSDRFASEFMNSRDLQGTRFRYEALLPKPTAGGSFQIMVGTLRGGVASATFAEGGL